MRGESFKLSAESAARRQPPIPFHDRVPERGVTGGGAPRSPARAGLVSWRLPEG
jgi:hypothetical protein